MNLEKINGIAMSIGEKCALIETYCQVFIVSKISIQYLRLKCFFFQIFEGFKNFNFKFQLPFEYNDFVKLIIKVNL